jgi:hypothetical protein
MTRRQLGEREIQMARYRFLLSEVTDPLAACLLRIIVGELESDLRENRDVSQEVQPSAAFSACGPQQTSDAAT